MRTSRALALVEHQLQRRDPEHQQARPTPSIGSLRVGVSRPFSTRAVSAGDDADRHVDPEDPRPRGVVPVSQPPSSGPATGATSVVIDQTPSAIGLSPGSTTAAAPATAGIIGPATKPCTTRKKIRLSSVGASPQAKARRRRRRAPNTGTAAAARALRHPAGQRHGDGVGDRERGDDPGACVGLTPRSPAIAGSETLAIVVSSTFMKVAVDSGDGGDRERGTGERRQRGGRGCRRRRRGRCGGCGTDDEAEGAAADIAGAPGSAAAGAGPAGIGDRFGHGDAAAGVGGDDPRMRSRMPSRLLPSPPVRHDQGCAAGYRRSGDRPDGSRRPRRPSTGRRAADARRAGHGRVRCAPARAARP